MDSAQSGLRHPCTPIAFAVGDRTVMTRSERVSLALVDATDHHQNNNGAKTSVS